MNSCLSPLFFENSVYSYIECNMDANIGSKFDHILSEEFYLMVDWIWLSLWSRMMTIDFRDIRSIWYSDVLFEYHRAVVPFCWAVRSLSSLPYSRLIAGIPILALFQNLRWNSNKTSLSYFSYWSVVGLILNCQWWNLKNFIFIMKRKENEN